MITLSNKIMLFILFLCAISVASIFLRETFAAVGTEVWQSSRANRPTRNMSYDIRGQPLSTAFNPYVSPWNISTLPVPVAQRPSTFPMTQTQFETNSIGLTLPKDETIKRGYLKGWPAPGNVTSSWINPALLNTQKRWRFYRFEK